MLEYKYKSYNNYETNPFTKISDTSDNVRIGEKGLLKIIEEEINNGKRIFALDMYTGVETVQIINLLKKFNGQVINTDSLKKSEEELIEMFANNITDDRVFGYMTDQALESCFIKEKIFSLRYLIANSEKDLFFIVGVGAGFIVKADVYIYFDITRWEIQLRFRENKGNWLFKNNDDKILTKFKIGYFIEWRLVDKHKEDNFNNIDYWVDANDQALFKIINKSDFYHCMEKTAAQPFRMEPYFDTSVWGGQWMKNMFNLNQEKENYGWSFDGVPEENSLNFKFGDTIVSFPCMNLVKLFPQKLLGDRVYKKFGAEFPIRFDMLDTFDGGNLSLQVHPTNKYIKTKFGMNYTQDESYYILDACEDSCVYLGLKKGIDKIQMLEDLRKANRGEIEFDVEKYINKIPVKKHDHILIPAGTIHCSGKNTQVLEISATPYIFTFKLWDWGQIGLDGLPRPVHIDHGEKNIDWSRDFNWVKDNLVNCFLEKENNKNFTKVQTGLHSLEFIQTNVYSIFSYANVCVDGVSVINLIEGESAIIKSLENKFEDTTIHYAETFIIPDNAGEYQIVNNDKEEIKIICANVRI